MYYLKTSEITWLEVKAYKLVVALAKYLQKNEFAYITGFSSSLYKTISAAEARIPLQALLVPTFLPCSWP